METRDWQKLAIAVGTTGVTLRNKHIAPANSNEENIRAMRFEAVKERNNVKVSRAAAKAYDAAADKLENERNGHDDDEWMAEAAS